MAIVIRHVANYDGHLLQLCALGRAPSALAGDQFDSDPLTRRTTRGWTIPLERIDCASSSRALLAKVRARLVGARVDQVDIDLKEPVTRRCCRCQGWCCRCPR